MIVFLRHCKITFYIVNYHRDYRQYLMRVFYNVIYSEKNII